MDLNHRPTGYEPVELPCCSIPRYKNIFALTQWMGYQDSNLGMSAPKADALPLGDTPMCLCGGIIIEI
jgi:hypothetical protein